jgi:N-acyl-D-aspartate/D-glutamate deacylase
LKTASAETVIDAKGLVVAPGFIDAHAHSDIALLANPLAESKIHMGVTTEVSYASCGRSAGPMIGAAKEDLKRNAETRFSLDAYGIEFNWTTLEDFFRKLETLGISTNFATLIGAGTVRAAVVGYENREPTNAELERMKAHVADAMKQGAFGITTGLTYTPGSYAKFDELVELSKVVAEYGGIYVTHLRSESNMLIECVKEAIEIGERAGLPAVISHFKASGKENWGKVNQALDMMMGARARGIDVTCDLYPYRAGMSRLRECLSPWAHEGGIDNMIELLKDPRNRDRLRREMSEGLPNWSSWVKEDGWENMMISTCPSNRQYEGKMIADLAEEEGADPFDFAFDLLIKDNAATRIIMFSMSEEDVRTVMRSLLSMFITDGYALAPYGEISRGKPHPRCYGTFPRALGEYVRGENVLTLQEAIRKMTSFAAQRFGLEGRGLIREGYWGDVTVFDPETIIDKATYQDPHRYPEGIKYVLVNGVVTIEDGEHTGARAGRILRRGT